MPPALELKAIEKFFGPVHANRGVSLTVPKGSITGIIGENGAGKSTVMNIVYGLYQPDGGEILVDGRQLAIANPRDAGAGQGQGAGRTAAAGSRIWSQGRSRRVSRRLARGRTAASGNPQGAVSR